MVISQIPEVNVLHARDLSPVGPMPRSFGFIYREGEKTGYNVFTIFIFNLCEPCSENRLFLTLKINSFIGNCSAKYESDRSKNAG